MRHKEEFTTNSYKEFPLEKILQKYKSESINEGFIFSRFQNLEKHYERLSRIRRGAEKDFQKLNSNFEKINEALGSLKSLQERNKKRTKGKERRIVNKELKFAKKEIKKERKELKLYLEEAEQERKEALENVRKFERDYQKEMEFIYSNKKVGKVFALGRLDKPGKFRIMEHLLMAQYTDIDLETFYNCEYLDSTDRLMLIGKGFISSEILEKRFKELPIRIKNLGTLIRDAEELEETYKNEYKNKREKGKVYGRINDLIYEKHFLEEYLEKN